MAVPLTGRMRASNGENITKHLIFLFDGTWNSAAKGGFQDITNVFRLNRVINGYDEEDIPQVTFYMPGPGTRGHIDDLLGGIYGQGLDQIIKESYVNLSCNYWPGDKLYFFGFSRGAVAAQALATMIWKCGLLKADYVDRINYVWDAFVRGKPPHVANKIKYVDPNVHPEPRISFLGLFDPVLGRNYIVPDKFTTLNFDGHLLSSNINRALQILSIDDNRKRFMPTLWRERFPGQIVEQVWMPGVHADVGGVGDLEVISTLSLLSMISRIRRHTKLSLDEDVISEFVSEIRSDRKISISNERSTLEMKPLMYADRKPDTRGVNQYKHPIVAQLLGQNILMRGKIRTYHADRITAFMNLKASDEQYFQEMSPIITDALRRTIG